MITVLTLHILQFYALYVGRRATGADACNVARFLIYRHLTRPDQVFSMIILTEWWKKKCEKLSYLKDYGGDDAWVCWNIQINGLENCLVEQKIIKLEWICVTTSYLLNQHQTFHYFVLIFTGNDWNHMRQGPTC